MKVSSQTLSAVALADKSWLTVYSELFKARLTFLVLLTTLVGFYLGNKGSVPGWLMLHTLVATALLASGASALNQLIEREYGSRMRRTQERPLPSGRLRPRTVLAVGTGCAVVGLVYLILAVNPVTALLGPTLCILFGVADARTVLASFADPIVFLFIGSFMLARAMAVHGLDRRIALGFLSWPLLAAHPARVLAGLGLVTAFI